MGLTGNRRAIIQQELNHCNKCGFCLPVCPTYLLTGSELDSPRGRLAMAEAAIRGEVPWAHEVGDAFSRCLGCRACETACPSGVAYSRVYEAARESLYQSNPAHTLPWTVRPLLSWVKNRRRLRRLIRAGRVVRALLPRSLRQLLPERLSPSTRHSLVATPTAAYFVGCISDAVYGEANDAAIVLLESAGYTVQIPTTQQCCGALHMHAGDRPGAEALARANLMAFSGELPVVNHAGGCGAFLKDYGHLLAGDGEWAERAAHFAERVRDLTESLDDAPQTLFFKGQGQRVALQNSCHLVNAQHIADRPKTWIRKVEGDQYVELPGTDRCCGSAGIYNVVQPSLAQQILDDKMQEIQTAQPDVLLVNNPGCALQMEHGSRATGGPPVMYLSIYLKNRLTAANPAEESAPAARE
ncbi:MAG: (Fe-S)-binding protein [Thermaerobacter sp.]|nr:(Fe-S)-binding protein [Thermaerobacter sp.]